MPMGAYVLSVTDGSAADNAGILVGDIITQVDGYDVQSRDDLAQELAFHSAGETCEVVVYRSGEYQTLTVTFDSVPETDTSTSPTDYFFPAA